MKFNLRHVIAFLLLIALSIGFGFGFDAIAHSIEKSNHPRPDSISSAVSQNAKEFGIPEAVIFATVKNGSNFASNAVSASGKIGLMQLSPEQLSFVCREVLKTEQKDAGLLYEPETNLYVGCAYLSYLYGRYGIWEHVFSAYHTDIETVDEWLQNDDYLSAQGVLIHIPNAATASYVQTLTKSAESYGKLYYQA